MDIVKSSSDTPIRSRHVKAKSMGELQLKQILSSGDLLNGSRLPMSQKAATLFTSSRLHNKSGSADNLLDDSTSRDVRHGCLELSHSVSLERLNVFDQPCRKLSLQVCSKTINCYCIVVLIFLLHQFHYNHKPNVSCVSIQIWFKCKQLSMFAWVQQWFICTAGDGPPSQSSAIAKVNHSKNRCKFFETILSHMAGPNCVSDSEASGRLPGTQN